MHPPPAQGKSSKGPHCPSGPLPLTWCGGRPLSSSPSPSPAQPPAFSASRILRGLPTTAHTGSPPQGPPTLGTPPLHRPEYCSLHLGCATSGQGPFPPSTGLWPPATLAPTLYVPGHVDSCAPDLCAPRVLGLVSRCCAPHFRGQVCARLLRCPWAQLPGAHA